MIARVPRLALAGLAVLSAALFASLAVPRLSYPLELDCIEGVMMDHVVRLAHGQSIFVEPSLRFIPLAYMPLFAFVSSLLVRVLGPHLWVPRLVSLLSVAGTCVLIARVVRLETRSLAMGAGGAAIYLMGFGLTGGCYDVARPDSLMLFLVLAAFVTLRTTSGAGGAIAAALLFVLAFFAKQHAALFGLAAALHLVVNQRRRVLPFVGVLAAGGLGGYVALEAWLGPWFRFFTLEVPSHWSRVSPVRMLHYFGGEVLGAVGLLSAATLLSLALPRRPWRGPDGVWMWAGLAAIGSGLMATLDPSAYLHVFMPTMVMISVLGPISLYRLARGVTESPANDRPAPGVADGIACLVLALQFLPLIYSVHTHRPHPRAGEAYRALMDDLRHEPGDVLMPYHGWYTWSAGKGTSLHIIALDDIARARGNSLLRRDPRFLERLFDPLRAGPHRPVIVTDVPLAASGPLWASLQQDYVVARAVGWISEPLRPVTGNRFTPTVIYVPRGSGAPRAAAPRAASLH